MLNVEQVIPGSYLVFTEKDSALIGAPPEILKHILKAGLPMPQTIVLPDNFHTGGHSQIALEFPFYHFLFIQGGLQAGRKFRIVGSEAQCMQVADLMRVTLLGPDYEEMIAWGTPPKHAKMLATEGNYLALKNPQTGEKFGMNELLDFVFYKKNRAPLFGEDAASAGSRVECLGGNRFKVSLNKKAKTVDLNLADKQLPPYQIPLASTPDHPVPFGVSVLGGGSGFDINNPTLGALLWINGNVVLWDSPAFIKNHLRARGVATEMIRAVIVSHMHEDHCNFTELLMDGHRPTVITTVEIYHCLLYKLAAIMGARSGLIADSLDFIPVEVGKPLYLFGGKFDFFYTIHSIPTLGAHISVPDQRDKNRSILFSGDVAPYSTMKEMKKAGAINQKRYDEMKNLIRGDEDYIFMDGGGAPVHGSPQDFLDCEQQIYFNHVSQLPPELDSVHGVMQPGMTFTIIESEPMPPWYTLGILEVFRLLRVNDHALISVIFSQGRIKTAAKGEIVIREKTPGDKFYFILSGALEVIKNGVKVASLDWGDFFGEIAIIKKTKRTATVRAVSPSVIFEIPGEIFMEIVERNRLLPVFEKIWDRRGSVEALEFFEGLDASAINQICLSLVEREYKSGETLVQSGRRNDHFFIIKSGVVKVKRFGKNDPTEKLKLGPGDFFGIKTALNSRRRTRKTVTASGPVTALVLSGDDLLQIQNNMPIVKHRLLLWLRRAGIKNAAEYLGLKPTIK